MISNETDSERKARIAMAENSDLTAIEKQSNIEPLQVVVEENLGTAYVYLKNKDDKIVGQLYTQGLQWIKPLRDSAYLQITVPSDGYNTIKGLK